MKEDSESLPNRGFIIHPDLSVSAKFPEYSPAPPTSGPSASLNPRWQKDQKFPDFPFSKTTFISIPTDDPVEFPPADPVDVPDHAARAKRLVDDVMRKPADDDRAIAAAHVYALLAVAQAVEELANDSCRKSP